MYQNKHIDQQRLKAFDLENESTDDVEVTEVADECRTDLGGLVTYLEKLRHKGVRLEEATLVGNTWHYLGVIPFEHYGFILPTSLGEYLSLDFSRKGIVWEIFDDYPDMPDGTFLVQRFSVNASRPWETIAQYCKQTKPFSFMFNDCKTWCSGFQKALSMELVQSQLKHESQGARSQNHIFDTGACR